LTFEQQLFELRPSHSVLIVPKLAKYEDESITFALAAEQRSALGSHPVRLDRPQTSVRNALRQMGMSELEHVQSTRAAVSVGGAFAHLGSLGMTAALFSNEDDEDRAREELDEEYDFVPNFELTIPARVPMAQAPATRSRRALAAREWPEESGVAKAHSLGIRGSGVVVGVLDTGVDADHEEFGDHLVNYRYVSLFPNSPYWPPRDVRGFDTDGHGSHVSGIIAGRNVGVAPEVALYAASVIESETTETSLLRVAYGLDWILRQFTRPDNQHRPGILNMSLGFPSVAPNDVDVASYNNRLRAMRSMLRTLKQANVLPLVAIGNDGANRYGYPGAFKDVLGVGAVDFNGNVAPFSGSGRPPGEGVTKPDVVGYGVGVLSSVERDFAGGSIYQRFNGTSMATPYVSGIAALYRCRNPNLSVTDTWDTLLKSAKSLSGAGRRSGAGLARFVA
jgi:subtilisin family serine protease